MKNILVLMHDDAGQEARFQVALDLARAVEGHLTCVDVSIVPVLADDGLTGAGSLLMADEQQREKANRVHMEERLKAEDVPYSWSDACGFLDECVHDAAALADVIVLNRALDTIDHPDMRKLVAEVVLKSGKPIVAVPEAIRRFDVSGHAMIAWDGSDEANAAIRAAVPLLAFASKVTLFEVDDGSVRLPAERAAEYLSRHGVKPVIERTSSAIDLPSTLIVDRLDETKAAYLVMGGFGHSRFTEALFGGVTRRMLGECLVPIFIAH